MKTRIFKMFMLPVAVFTLASAAAVSTDKSHESKTTVTMLGYIHNPSIFNCEEKSVECRIGGGPTCVFGAWDVFEKNGEGECIVPLERL